MLDHDGVIVDTKEAWRLFSHLNGGSARMTGLGVNYLDVCDRAETAGCDDAGAIAMNRAEGFADDLLMLKHRRSRGLGTGSCRWRIATSTMLSPRYGVSPVRSSKSRARPSRRR